MRDRHAHKFAPKESTGQLGKDDRLEQYCSCGARRCAAESSMGFFKIRRRCLLAARKDQRTCRRHHDKLPLYTMTIEEHSAHAHDELMKSVGKRA